MQLKSTAPNLKQIYETNRAKISHPNYQKGYDGEFATYVALRRSGIADDNDPILDVNKWLRNNYKRIDRSLPRFSIEVKNWGYLERPDVYVSPERFNKQILERFQKDDPLHKKKWILIISKAKFSEKVKRLIKAHKIKVIEVGHSIDQNNIWKTVDELTPKLSRLL